MILANRFPRVKDDSLAFKDRMMFITFPNEFIGDQQIQNIESSWLNDSVERSGILNWMMEGLRRLLVNKKFSESRTQTETRIAFMRQ